MKYIRYICLALLTLGSSYAQAQNFIYNPGFENGDLQGAQSEYNNTSTGTIHETADFLYNWERAKGVDGSSVQGTNTSGNHSPDWSYEGTLPQLTSTFGCSTSPFPPYQPNGMLGMGICELIQQKFDRNGLEDAMEFSATGMVRISFQVRLANSFPSGTQLKVYLSKKRLKYKSNWWGYYDYYALNGNSNFIVAGLTTNLSSVFSESEWREYEVVVPYSTVEDYKYIGIGTEPSSVSQSHLYGFHCSSGYLRIDQVSMSPYCEESCYSVEGPLALNVSSNVVHPSSTMVISGINNATELDLLVYVYNGQTVYHNTAYCPEGIGQDIVWDGTSIGGAPVTDGVYKYIITVRNSCYIKEYKGTMLKQGDYAGPNVSNFGPTCTLGPNQTPEICCLADLYKDYEVLVGPGFSPYVVQDNIWACTAQPDFSDEVRVESNADVLFRAGSQITLAEGFHTVPGAVFLAEIAPCDGERPGVVKSVEIPVPADDTFEAGENRSWDQKPEYVSVYPNPTDGQLHMTLNFPEREDVEVIVTDMYGRTLYRAIVQGMGTSDLDLSAYPDGFYYVTVIAEDQRITRKVILQ